MKIINLLCFILFFNCLAQENNFQKQVGDIQFDSKIDDPNFKICNLSKAVQYYMFEKGVQYKGEKYEIIKVFRRKYKSIDIDGETGYITIRFLVNCNGNSGLFRITSMNENYLPKIFNDEIVGQLLSITKSLDGWSIGKDEDKTYDYYQYLTFKIENGKLIEILP